MIHKTVLLQEAVENLKLKPGMIVVDVTLGAGGHSLEILKKISKGGVLVVFDQDENAIIEFKKKIEKDENLKVNRENIILINENFENIKESLANFGISRVDAILADLGISSDQLEDEEMGLSFKIDSRLDMRLDRKGDLTAEQVINSYSEDDLKRILQEFGDEKYAGKIARRICQAREEKKIERTTELVSIIEKAVPAFYRRGKINCATKTFQALRIEVNRELDVLRKIIVDGIELLSANGRMAIITFHSGEDRIVKNIFREYARGCICPPEFPVCRCDEKEIVKIITRKPICPGEKETRENSRSRSAKLRVIEKI